MIVSSDINTPSKSFLNKIKFFKTDIRDFDGVVNATKDIDYIFHMSLKLLAKDKNYLIQLIIGEQ